MPHFGDGSLLKLYSPLASATQWLPSYSTSLGTAREDREAERRSLELSPLLYRALQGPRAS
jgi:hypothetical protein